MAPRQYKLTPAESRRLDRGRCSSERCRAELLWYVDPGSGAKVPLDVASSIELLCVETPGTRRYVSHFTTCKDPGRFSKARRPRP